MSGSESDRVVGEGVTLSKGVGKASLMRWHLNRDLKVAKDKPCRGWKEPDWWVWVTWSRVWPLRSHSKENDEAARGVGGSAATWRDPEWSHWAKAVRGRQTPYAITYMWTLKVWYKQTHLQNRKGFTDVENKFMVTTGGRRASWWLRW